MPKTVNEAMNRGNNLAAILFIIAIGLGLIGEIVMEKDLVDKMDDAIIVVLAIIAFLWYTRIGNNIKRSATPLTLLIVTFALKVAAFIIELDDKEAVGDELGLLLPLLVMVIITTVLYTRAKNQTIDVQ